ncbi:MAG TPA: alpha/beta hydrolase [Schlesneria sp.]
MIHRSLCSLSLSMAAIALIAVAFGSTCRAEVVIEQDLVYGKGGEVELKLDLARPKEGEGPFPGLVLIHGGGWSGGKRQDFKPVMQQAAEKGYVAITITYRLTEPDPATKQGKIPFPAQIEDCKCAVRWLKANAQKYHVDPDHIGVGGASAGGHLSLLVGLTDAKSKLEGQGGNADQSSRVQAVVNIFGPTEMVECWKTSPQARPFIQGLIGKPDDAPDAYKAASPVTYVTDDDPPVLTLHGASDTLVPPSQAQLLDDAIKLTKAKHELLILEGQGHGFNGESQKKAADAMWAFLDKHLKTKAQ